MTDEEIEKLDFIIDDLLPKYLNKLPTTEPFSHPSIYRQHYPEKPEDIRKYADEVEEYNKKHKEYLNKLKIYENECGQIYKKWLMELFKLLNIENHPKLDILIQLAEQYSKKGYKTEYTREHFIHMSCVCFDLAKLLH